MAPNRCTACGGIGEIDRVMKVMALKESEIQLAFIDASNQMWSALPLRPCFSGARRREALGCPTRACPMAEPMGAIPFRGG